VPWSLCFTVWSRIGLRLLMAMPSSPARDRYVDIRRWMGAAGRRVYKRERGRHAIISDLWRQLKILWRPLVTA
jgi:hypothetical protein